MGLFDGKGLSPTPTTVLGMAQGAARGLGKALLDPMMESQGYLSEEKQVMNIMKGVDMSDPQSFTDAFNALLKVNADAANEFRTQGLPMLKLNMEANQTKERKIVNRDGIPYYADTGKPVIDDGYVKKDELSATDKNFELDQRGRDIIATGKYDTNTTEGLMSALVALQGAGLAGRPLSKTLRESLDKRLGLKDSSLVDITEISKLDNIYRQHTDKYQNSLDSALELDTLITQAEGGNPISWNAVQQKTSQLIGDSRISVDEIRRLNNAGSIGQKVANLLSTWLTGVPTSTRLADYRQVLDGIGDINYARLKAENAKVKGTLEAATPDPKQRKALLDVAKNLFALPSDPSKTTSRIQLETKRTLCRQHYSYVQLAEKGDAKAGAQANLLAKRMGERNIVCGDINW